MKRFVHKSVAKGDLLLGNSDEDINGLNKSCEDGYQLVAQWETENYWWFIFYKDL